MVRLCIVDTGDAASGYGSGLHAFLYDVFFAMVARREGNQRGIVIVCRRGRDRASKELFCSG